MKAGVFTTGLSLPLDFSKVKGREFPGGPVIENVPASSADTGSKSGPGGIPPGTEKLSPCTTIIEPVCLQLVLCN